MCFSAGASFGAGIVLSAIGMASMRKVKSIPQILFASIPLMFAAQQITEGLLWITLRDPSFVFIQRNLTYVFLFLAQVTWPVWIPFSILLLDKGTKYKRIQKVFVFMGVVISIYLGYCLFVFPVEAQIMDYHILYVLHYPHTRSLFGSVFYIVAILAPPFFSTVKKLWMLGLIVFFSFLVSILFYQYYFVSVWCFFASITSISVLFILREINGSKNTVPPVPLQLIV